MRPLIAGNWKMNGMAQQLGKIEAIAALVKAAPPFADVLICPPVPHRFIGLVVVDLDLRHPGLRLPKISDDIVAIDEVFVGAQTEIRATTISGLDIPPAS